MNAEKIQEILAVVLVILFGANVALTAAKTICDKIVEKFGNESAGKLSAVFAKIAGIISKVLEFVSANTVKKA